jgi:trehalose-6-phosphatase
MPGLDVFNVLPPDGPTKGEALLGLVRSEGAERALFAGDDTTDEDVFRLPPSSRLLTVRVGEARDSAAGFFLRTQAEIDDLLARLVAARERPR